jgi:predicted NBD/HSP70 family sugar kinase
VGFGAKPQGFNVLKVVMLVINKSSIGNAAMPADLKTVNRYKVLECLRSSDVITVNEIAEKTGISRQTTIKAVERFTDMGVVSSLGKGSSTKVGGKRPELFRFNADFLRNICVRFENHSVIVALTDLQSACLCIKKAKHAPNTKINAIMHDIQRLYTEIITEFDLTADNIFGFGVCLGGICDANTGIMRYNSLYPAWGRNIPIVDLLRKFVPESIKILIANDSKMTGVAEIFRNPSLAEKSFVTLYTLDGISSSYINRGNTELGEHGLIGEIGHITVDIRDDEVCSCGSKGCFEVMVSEKRLQNITVNDERFPKSLLYNKEELSIGDYFTSAKAGDKLAIDITEYIADYFTVAIRSILLNADPELIIIQGKYAVAGEYFTSLLNKRLEKFGYYPENGIRIEYDHTDVCTLALEGLAYTLNNLIFDDEKMYK